MLFIGAAFALVVAACGAGPEASVTAETTTTVAATTGDAGADGATTTVVGAPTETSAPSESVPSEETTTVPERTDRIDPTTTVPNAERIDPGVSKPVVGEVPAAILDPILEDAATRTGVAVGSLVLVRAEAVIWSDGSLGCPEPGMGYTQALVEGYWIVVDGGGTTVDYRATQQGGFIVCTQPGASGGTVPTAPDK